jgi:serine/threonine protein kinase
VDQGRLTGQRLGAYQLEALLGAGGMAEVYRARDPQAGREVAVKVLPAFLASDPGYVRRFREEAERVRALKHPHIVPVYFQGSQGDLLYLVMPLLKESLRDRLDRERLLPPMEAARIIGEIATALQAAHGRRLIHRDVKPENILLDDQGTAMLTDFGIARQLKPRQGGTLYTLSASGLPVGTPEYMAPEQLRGEHIDERSDIYGLGAVLYELLTGTVPHAADTPYEVAARVLTEPITPPSQRNGQIWRELEDVVMTALAPEPKNRFQDARTFRQALRHAVLPPGSSMLATGLPRLRRITQRSLRRSASQGAPAVGVAIENVAIEAAPTLPPSPALESQWSSSASAWPTIRPAAAPGRVRTQPPSARRGLLLTAAIALLILTVCGGGSLLAASRLGLAQAGTHRTPTATATLQPTDTPEATDTPQPTATAMPVPRLGVGPFSWHQTFPGGKCHWNGTQEVSNPSGGTTLGWHWQSVAPAPPSFRWGFDNPPLNGGYPIANSQSAGASSQLYVTFSCSSTNSFRVTMLDAMSRVYFFTMQPS